jgi:GntR family transcriptional regulator, transcriptional repressor for pyruvate dehydrogenase complex
MFNRIERPRVLRAILDQIKESIAGGKLKKGDKLPSERQMSEMLGVSRAAIREAVKSLEMIGLVECVQGGGNYIARNLENSMTEPLSIMFMLEGGSILQVQQLRRALEVTSARLAAVSINPDDLACLEDICRQMETRDSSADQAAADRSFHAVIAAASSNPLLITTQNAASALIENQIRDVRNAMLREKDTLVQVNVQHKEIVAALSAHSPEQAVAAMNRHMDYIERFLIP